MNNDIHKTRLIPSDKALAEAAVVFIETCFLNMKHISRSVSSGIGDPRGIGVAALLVE